MSSTKIIDSFDRYLIEEYFRHGSIEQVLINHHYDLPVSFATYHRLLDRLGVVKSAGPNSKLSESLHLLSLINSYKVPLERVIHKYAPASINVSINTLHRIMHHIRLGVTRRVGTALLVSPEGRQDVFLVGKDQTLKNPSLGLAGDYSLPMGHTRMQDSHVNSVRRVMQQEMYTNLILDNQFPDNLITEGIKPIMYINIADIRVAVYRLLLPEKLCHFSSFKLDNFGFFNQSEIQELKTRPGVNEIVRTHEATRFNPTPANIPEINADLNLALAEARMVK